MDIRTVSRWAGAAALVAGPVAISVPNLVTDESTPIASQIGDYAADPGTAQVSNLLLLLIIAMVPAMFCTARLARPGAPRLAFAGGALAGLGWIAGLMSIGTGQVALYQASLLPEQDRAAAAALIEGLNGDPVYGTLIGIFVIGHIVGMVLLGIALWRSRAVPVWVAGLFIAYPVLHFAGQFAGAAADYPARVALLISAVAIAVQVVRTPDDRWDRPAGTRETAAVPGSGAEVLPGALSRAHNQR